MNEEHQTFATPSIAKLAAALAKAQKELTPVTKDSENPFFKSKYADLAACLRHAAPILAAHGLAVCQTTRMVEGKVELTTTLMHESGESMAGTLCLKPTKEDPQGHGSVITYMRRYGYAAIVGLAQEDDDGNSASDPKPKGGATRRQQEPPTDAGDHGSLPGTEPEKEKRASARNAPRAATEKTREWFCRKLAESKLGTDFLDYGRAIGTLKENEGLTEWPLDSVPTSEKLFAAMVNEVAKWKGAKQ